MCVSLGAVEMPRAASPARRRAALRWSCSRRHGSRSTSRSAARAAATWGGASAQVKMKLRAALTSSSRSAAEPATNAPKEPSALPSVPTSTSTSASGTPASSALPRPPAPRQPIPCASSSSTSAPWRRAAASIGASGARSPSMLYTPSSTTRMRRCARATARSRSSSAPASPCANTCTAARERRHPSMMEAWTSSSDITASPGPTSAGITPRFAW